VARVRYGVVGDPVAHSLSPVLHAAAYDALDIEALYTADRVPEGGLAAHVAALSGQWRGLSVTAPLKREALALAGDGADEAAVRAGGANTLLLGGKRVAAHTTDVPGAAAAMSERSVGPDDVTVLGGGATAAAVGLAACDLGARRVRLLARTPARAADAAAAVRSHPSAPRVEVLPLEPAAVAGDLVVGTVPVAAQSAELVAACLGARAVFEVLYDPWPTPLAAAARAPGLVVVAGLDLLVHQAVLQVTLMTGRPGPLEPMRAAGEAALAARRGSR
jgi:shikimate dehydrogenase